MRRASVLRALYVCQQNPWRLSGGALIRNYWLVRALAERFPVDLVTADDASEAIPPDFAAVCASVSRFPRPAGGALRLRRVSGMLRPGGSYFTSGSILPALRRRVRDLSARGPCLGMTDLQMNAALPRSLPFVYNAHNAEYELLRRRASLESSAPARSFLRLEARRIQPIERRLVRDALLIAACSEEDRRDLARLAPEATGKMLIVPNGVDVTRYAGVARAPGEAGAIVVTGSYDWRPNLRALDWFVRDVVPALQVRHPAGGYEICVAGRMSARLAASLDALPHVRAVPNPADIREELARASIVAAPVLASSGTRLRILEAWAAGRPVVTTAAGAFGLDYRAGEDLLEADGAQAFAAALVQLLDDEATRHRLSAAGLLRAQSYAWPRIAHRFVSESEPLLRTLSSA